MTKNLTPTPAALVIAVLLAGIAASAPAQETLSLRVFISTDERSIDVINAGSTVYLRAVTVNQRSECRLDLKSQPLKMGEHSGPIAMPQDCGTIIELKFETDLGDLPINTNTDGVSNSLIAPVGPETTVTPMDCTKQFVATWNRWNREGTMPVPKQPCTMRTKTGLYLCDVRGCGRPD